MKGVSKIIFLGLVVISSLMAWTVGPVYAEESRDITGEKSIGNNQHDHDEFGDDDSAVPREGYDERVHCSCRAPTSFSEFPGLTIDSAFISATPHWMFLTAGEKEQQAILQYLNNADISVKKQPEWKRFLKGIWNKYPVRYIKTKTSAVLKPGNTHDKYSLTARENATFREIEAYIAQDMEKTQQNVIVPMFLGPTHTSFTKNALIQGDVVDNNEKYYLPLVDSWSRDPDDWYKNDPIPYDHQLNHGFVPVGISVPPFPFIVLPPQIVGVGFAPDNYGKYASLAKQEFAARSYNDAFKDMAYASHFISDLGNPYHTPMIQIIPLQFVDSPYSLIAFPNTQMIINYELLHNNYENYVQANFASFGTTSESYVPISPTDSAKGHGVYSWAANYPLMYSCYWHYIINRNFDFGSNPAIVSISQNRIIETAKHNNGLVQYVTGGGPITFTITPIAGSGGSITPSSPVIINYGQSQTFTIQTAPNYVVDDVKVNGVSTGSITQFTFDTDTLNKAKGDQTIDVTFKSTAPPTPPVEWIWSRDGWGDWQHAASWSGTQVGLNSEYGPVMVNSHGEHGTITHLLGGSVQASVWRTFWVPFLEGEWNTLTFNGVLQRSDVPGGRWMKIEVNGQQVFFATELDIPPGQWSEPFEIKVQFPQTPVATVKISHGQNSAWGPRFMMEYDSLRLSLETDSQVTSITTPTEIFPENVIAANMTEAETPAMGQ